MRILAIFVDLYYFNSLILEHTPVAESSLNQHVFLVNAKIGRSFISRLDGHPSPIMDPLTTSP